MRSRLVLAIAGLTAVGTAQTQVHAFHGSGSGDRFGISVDGAGDVDRDGHADLVVGAFWADPTGQNSGLLQVHSGLDGSVLWTATGGQTWDELGWVVAGAGDVNGDGIPDVISGAPLDDDVNGTDTGTARVFSGLDGSLIWLFAGDNPRDLFGSSVDGAGDVNGDGYADLIVGQRFDDGVGDDPGRAKVFSGRDGSVLYSFVGPSTGDYLGWCVAGVGDVDGDQFDDFAIGVPRDDTVGSNAGLVRVHSGRTGAVIWSSLGEAAGDQFGLSIAGVGDLDGDGHAELIVGAPYSSAVDYRSGRAYLVDGASGSVLRTFDGSLRNEFFAWSVAGLGDVDADGTGDLAIGSWRASPNGTESGQAWIRSGSDGALIGTLTGDSAGDRLGWSVAGAGDVTADGHAEVIVGAYLDDVTALGSGSAFVFGFPSTNSPPVLRERGVPCAGSNGSLPRISLVGIPSIGRTFDVRMRGGTAGAPCVMNLGAAIALPLDALGAPGCSGYADPGGLSLGAATDSLGLAVIAIALPPDPALVGLRLDFQWIVRDIAANTLGFVFSDALGVTFGG